jgi:hypothetical protein
MIRPNKKNGFALPMALIAISGMLILLMGLLTILALERKTARSYADAARAELALQSGLADAIATISPVAMRDDSLVFRLEDPALRNNAMLFQQQPKFFTLGSTYDIARRSWRVVPFFSGVKEFQSTLAEVGPSNNASRPSGEDISNSLKVASQSLTNFAPSTLTRHHVPTAAWVDLTAPNSSYKTRFAWWVEDLSGRIDGKNAGSLPRIQSLDPRETGLYTIYAPTTDRDAAGPEDSLVAKRGSLRSSASIRTILPAIQAEKIEPWITYSLPATTTFAPLIPHGFGYLDAGTPRLNLNNLIEQRNVIGIAAHIDKNLPNWNGIRKGGFPATDNYTKTLAASIIDYADVDSDATTGPDFRGVDSYPFVNEIFDRYEWRSTTSGNVIIRVTTYIELWNLTQQSISGSMQLENINRHTIRIPPAANHTFTPVTYSAQPVSIPPNGFKVVDCGFSDYQFPVGAFPPSTLDYPSDTFTSSYRLRWNSNVVDWARGNATRTSGTLRAGSSNAKWKGNASPAHDHSIGQHGDPRASYYITARIFPNNYDANSNWGGRALKPTISNTNYREVKLLRWPDRGWESTVGAIPGSDTRLPIGLAYPANQPNMAPAFIANSSRLQSVAELGNIFDPAQWNNVEVLSGAASPSAGGGISLAIGRPEYAVFDKEGLRAAQLLDLFHSPNSYDFPCPRININTAPREVLRTLIAGQELTLDPQLGSNFPTKQPSLDTRLTDTSVANRFADAVIATRNRGPLRSLSDLNLIRTNPLTARSYPTSTTGLPQPANIDEPFFGSRLHYTPSPLPDDKWDDAGREELFRRVANLVTFQSKTFRIIIAGQVLDRSDNVIGRRSREFHVQLEPARNPDLTVNLSKPASMKIVYARDL